MLRVLCLLALLLTSPLGRASGQAVEPGPGVQSLSAGGRWFQQDPLLLPTGAWQERIAPGGATYVPSPDLASAEAKRGRPWWLLPASGAVVGGAAFTYLTYRACQREDCIFPVGTPLLGIGLGAILGFGIEAVLD